ncbi:MAG: LysR substrate-binding domain-containing protein [Pseudomonadota bacterium]
MARNIDTDLLRALIAVAETGGFTSATQTLHQTQSAISMQIKRLEGLVRAELFIRSKKGIQLTPAGEELLDYARKIVQLNDEAIEHMLDRRATNVVRIGMMEDYASAVMPGLLKAFLSLHPDVYVEVTTGLSSRMLPLLGRQFDLVLAVQGEHVANGEFVRKEQPVWACAPGMDLDQPVLPVAVYGRDCVIRDIMAESLGACGRRWRVAYHSASIHAVQAAVVEGIAVGVFKRSTVPPQLRVLDAASGFAQMEQVNVVLYRAPGASLRSASHLLAEFIHHEIGGAQPMASSIRNGPRRVNEYDSSWAKRSMVSARAASTP